MSVKKKKTLPTISFGLQNFFSRFYTHTDRRNIRRETRAPWPTFHTAFRRFQKNVCRATADDKRPSSARSRRRVAKRSRGRSVRRSPATLSVPLLLFRYPCPRYCIQLAIDTVRSCGRNTVFLSPSPQRPQTGKNGKRSAEYRRRFESGSLRAAGVQNTFCRFEIRPTLYGR